MRYHSKLDDDIDDELIGRFSIIIFSLMTLFSVFVGNRMSKTNIAIIQIFSNVPSGHCDPRNEFRIDIFYR